jgi:hypothetical protein
LRRCQGVRRIAPGALSRNPEAVRLKDVRFALEPERRLAGGFSHGRRGPDSFFFGPAVGKLASQLEAFSGRLSPLPKS